ncbi:MAG: hypothetical protein ABF370_16900, partial [Verrucomicrobiales bacterium]
MTEPSCPEEPSLKQGELEKALVTHRLVRDSDSTLLSGAPSSLLDGELPKFQPCVIHVSDSAGPMHHS